MTREPDLSEYWKRRYIRAFKRFDDSMMRGEGLGRLAPRSGIWRPHLEAACGFSFSRL